MAEESEQLLGLVRRAACSHEERLYLLRQARYTEARAEDLRRRKAESEDFTAWALARNAA